MPHKKFSNPHFSELWKTLFTKSLIKLNRYEMSVSFEFCPNLTSRIREKRLKDETGFWGMGAKSHSPTGNQTPKIYGLVHCQFLVAKISTPEHWKWEIFWPGPKFWGPLAPPPKGVGGRESCRLVDLVKGYAHKNFCENRNSGFREKPTRKFFP